jgi:ubiquinone/menaquinone biosynthesis C-methylase UbiE
MQEVEAFYSKGNIYTTIIDHLTRSGYNTANLTRKDIAAIDEFHIRGQEATRELAVQAHCKPGMRVLDIGCGLGGACRLLAAEFGCMTTGVDITAEYIDTAQKLSQLTGLQEGTHFVQTSALDLPFPANSFDMVWTQHAQMNIADKQGFYREVARVMSPGARFVYYDVFKGDDDPLYFPVPWADGPSISHLISTAELKEQLREAGLTTLNTNDQTAKSIIAIEKIIDRANKNGLPPLGIHLLMGDEAMEKLKNLLRNLCEKRIVVESGIADRARI